MEEYLNSLYKPELKRILLKLATDFDIYQKIISFQIGVNNERKRELNRLKKQKP